MEVTWRCRMLPALEPLDEVVCRRQYPVPRLESRSTDDRLVPGGALLLHLGSDAGV